MVKRRVKINNSSYLRVLVVKNFSGHAWAGGLFLEDELGRVHAVTTEELLAALKGLPRPLDLGVLSGCETAADDARSVAWAL